ncbi:MAG: hypothetical protein ACYCVN_09695 [Acidimicrobiales bacterium]
MVRKGQRALEADQSNELLRTSENQRRSGLRVLDGVLVVGGGLVALLVIFKLVGFIAGILWFGVKVLVLLAIVAIVIRLVFGRRS